MSIHKANKKGFINSLLIGTALLPLVLFFLVDLNPLEKRTLSAMEIIMERPFILLPLWAPFGLILWSYLTTKYWIKDGHLHYTSAFLKGKIPVTSIRKIVKGKTMWVGLKPALAKNGLIIHYNRFDEIYMAPQSNDKMVAELLEIHPSIEIIEAKAK
ncbi:MAG: PH domain-containing protein [Flavobacteriia bacterium]|nr:PH domain-containing protein [Flavobacteriia bacterium]